MGNYSYTTKSQVIGSLSSGQNTRIGIKLLTGHPIIGKHISQVTLALTKTLLPTGILTVTIRDNNDNILASGDIDVSTLPLFVNGPSDFLVNLGINVLMQANYRILAEYSNGDISNYVQVWGGNSGIPSNTNASTYNGSYTDDATKAVYTISSGLDPQSQSISDTATLTESATVKPSNIENKDQVTISDSIFKLASKSTSDSSSFVDTVSAIKNDKLLSDTVTISDSVTKTISKQVSDTTSNIESVITIKGNLQVLNSTSLDILNSMNITSLDSESINV